MGFTPAEVNEMTLWEYSCCCAGTDKKAHGRGDMSIERLRELGIQGF